MLVVRAVVSKYQYLPFTLHHRSANIDQQQYQYGAVTITITAVEMSVGIPIIILVYDMLLLTELVELSCISPTSLPPPPPLLLNNNR